MATVTVTLTDNAQGDVDVSVSFAPLGLDASSPAHLLAVAVVRDLQGDEGDISDMEVMGHG